MLKKLRGTIRWCYKRWKMLVLTSSKTNVPCLSMKSNFSDTLYQTQQCNQTQLRPLPFKSCLSHRTSANSKAFLEWSTSWENVFPIWQKNINASGIFCPKKTVGSGGKLKLKAFQDLEKRLVICTSAGPV